LGHDLQRVDVETGIGFVHDRHLGLQHTHLQNLVALLFAAGKAFIQKRFVNSGECQAA
jgi:hypothetical protein